MSKKAHCTIPGNCAIKFFMGLHSNRRFQAHPRKYKTWVEVTGSSKQCSIKNFFIVKAPVLT
jgi:hypothetical protein